MTYGLKTLNAAGQTMVDTAAGPIARIIHGAPYGNWDANGRVVLTTESVSDPKFANCLPYVQPPLVIMPIGTWGVQQAAFSYGTSQQIGASPPLCRAWISGNTLNFSNLFCVGSAHEFRYGYPLTTRYVQNGDVLLLKG